MIERGILKAAVAHHAEAQRQNEVFHDVPAGRPFLENLVSLIIRNGMLDAFDAQVSADNLQASMVSPLQTAIA